MDTTAHARDGKIRSQSTTERTRQRSVTYIGGVWTYRAGDEGVGKVLASSAEMDELSRFRMQEFGIQAEEATHAQTDLFAQEGGQELRRREYASTTLVNNFESKSEVDLHHMTQTKDLTGDQQQVAMKEAELAVSNLKSQMRWSTARPYRRFSQHQRCAKIKEARRQDKIRT